ncbi:MAG: hypothetical protein UY96_C0010G0017 [Parcubacteria group bacterium GW2011_GWB1_56_8]|nr:MAG: hypothetical protein UY96_C0010G0017 [Parcubacteria group bacterium GW2011_GWB1_56_8]
MAKKFDILTGVVGTGLLIAGVRTIKKAITGDNGEEPFSGHLAASPELGRVMKVYDVGHSLDERLKHVKEMVTKGRRDPRLREIAAKILTRKCGENWCSPEKDSESEAKAIFDAFRKQVRYTRDAAGIDQFQHPMVTWTQKAGDCDDAVILIATLLAWAGFNSLRARVIKTDDAEDWSHIYNLVGFPPMGPVKKWVALDGSVSKPAGWEPPASMIVAKRDFDLL